MKANELMIGDWVLFSGKPKRVESIFVSDNGVEQIYVFGNTSQVSTINAYIQPIPLTEEILEKNGFEYDDTNIGWGLGTHDFMIELGHIPFEEDEDYLFVWVADKRARLDYVHELQHALRLCRIDKEIEL